MSLTSRLQALLTYANEKTEAGDTTIGAAIKTLCDGYSGASGSATYPTITDADTLSSRMQALIAYADETTGEGDATLAEAIKRLCDGYNTTPQWMLDAVETYGIPLQNLKDAYAIDEDIKSSFDGTGRWLYDSQSGYINLGVVPSGTEFSITIVLKFVKNSGWKIMYGTGDSDGGICYKYYASNLKGFPQTAGSVVSNFGNPSEGSVYTLQHNYSKITLDTWSANTSATNALSTSNPFKIGNTFYGYIASADITLNGKRYYLVPFANNGDTTMIDLMADNCTENLPTKVGTFTIV